MATKTTIRLFGQDVEVSTEGLFCGQDCFLLIRHDGGKAHCHVLDCFGTVLEKINQWFYKRHTLCISLTNKVEQEKKTDEEIGMCDKDEEIGLSL